MTLDAAKPKHRFVALDSLRGVCACMVVLYHYGTQSHLGQLAFVQNSMLFVDFFFVLSGFVIGWSYGQRLSEGFPIGRFMALRLGRVYPLHAVMLLVFLAFELGFAFNMLPAMGGRAPFTDNYSVDGLIASVLALQNFIGPEAGWNAPSWSIAAEIWTYLIFALILRYLGRWLVPVCMAIVVVAIAVIPLLSDHYINVVHEGAILRCMYGFALGVIGWRIMRYVERPSLGSRMAESALELVAVALVVAFVSVAEAGPLSMIAPLVFFAAVMVFARERGIVSVILRTPPLVLVGTLSYSIYMIHWFLLWRYLNGVRLLDSHGVFARIVHALDLQRSQMPTFLAFLGDVLTLGFLAIVIFCAYLSYRLIELPGQKAVKRWLKKKGKAPGAIEPATGAS